MPKATDLIVKNAALVDKTFELITPAAGTASSALWQLKDGAYSSVFPSLEASSRANAGRTARKALFTFKKPSSYTSPTTGLAVVGSSATVNMTVTVPADFPESEKSDFVAYFTNLMNTALVKSLIRDALPAN